MLKRWMFPPCLDIEYDGRRLIVCHNSEQAKRDKAKRIEIIGRLTEKLRTQGLKSLLVVG